MSYTEISEIIANVFDTWIAPASITPAAVSDVDSEVAEEFLDLHQIWVNRYDRNVLRTAYFDAEIRTPHKGFSIPPQMQHINAVVGWPRKAVKSFSQRLIFDGFVAPNEGDDPYELSEVLVGNEFGAELPQAISSALKHGCSFLTVTRGDRESGEPKVVIQPRSAEWSAAKWDKRRREIKSALAIKNVRRDGQIDEATIYLPDRIVDLRLNSKGRWVSDERPHSLGRVPVVALRHAPELDKPFGHSRMTRAAMYYADGAMRTLMRNEVGSEFFTAPQRYVLGGDDSTFEGQNRWSLLIGRILHLTKDEDGDTPTVGSFPQMTMQPLSEQLRNFAALFASEVNLPVSALGIIHDNPASAEAMYAANEDLIVDAINQSKILDADLSKLGRMIVEMRDGRAPSGLWQLSTRWRNPAFSSPTASTDALVKANAVFPWLGETDVALELAGFTDDQITRLLADKTRAEGNAIVRRVLENPAESQPVAREADE